jgi:drug/metabolite transporter (DMT)-like permease
MSRPHPALLATLLCVLWSLAFVVQRIGLRDADPLWFAAGRVAISGLALAPALLLGAKLGRRGHALAVLLGATNVAGFFGLQIAGLAHVESGPAAAMIYLQPLMVIVLAALLLGEPLTARRATGALVALAGVVVVGGREVVHGSTTGTALLVGAALSWAVGTILLKRGEHLPLVPLVAAQSVYGAVPLVVLAAVLEPAPELTSRVTLTVLYAGLGAGAAGWVLMGALLRRGAAGHVSAQLFIVPVLAAVFGVLLGDEPLRASLVVAIGLVALGVRLATTDPAAMAVRRARTGR